LKGRKTGENARMFLGTLHLVLMNYGYDGNKFKIRHFNFKKIIILNLELEMYNVFL